MPLQMPYCYNCKSNHKPHECRPRDCVEAHGYDPTPTPLYDPVNHPQHYKEGGIETIDFIEAKGMGFAFCLGNAIKYISRAGKKDPDKLVEDLRKAIWYVERAIHNAAKAT